MVRGDLKNMERNLSHIIHMYRPFLMVVHWIFTHYLAQDKKEYCHFAFGAVTQISIIVTLLLAVDFRLSLQYLLRNVLNRFAMPCDILDIHFDRSGIPDISSGITSDT